MYKIIGKVVNNKSKKHSDNYYAYVSSIGKILLYLYREADTDIL